MLSSVVSGARTSGGYDGVVPKIPSAPVDLGSWALCPTEVPMQTHFEPQCLFGSSGCERQSHGPGGNGGGGEQRGTQPGTQEQGLVPAGLGGFQGASGEGAEQRGPSEMGAELLSLLQPLDAGLYFSKVVLYNSQVLLHCLLDLRGWE